MEKGNVIIKKIIYSLEETSWYTEASQWDGNTNSIYII